MSTAEIQVRTLGAFELSAPLQHIPKSDFVALLAASFPNVVSRREIYRCLWEGASPTVAQNRLRVNLSRWRRLLPMEVSTAGVRLDPSSVEVDHYQVRQAIRAALDEPADSAELRGILAELSALSSPLLPEIESEWVLPYRDQWEDFGLEAIARLVTISEGLDMAEVTIRACRAGLAVVPENETLWTSYVKAALSLREEDSVLNEIRLARRKLLQDGEDFSPEFLEFIDAVPLIKAEARSEPLTPAEMHLLASFFARALEAEPEVALQVLASSSFRPEVLKSPVVALRMLRRALRHPHPPSEERERCEVRVLSALSLLYEEAAVIEESEKFLAQEISLSRRRIALLNRSFALFQVGRVEEALGAIEEAITIAEGTGWSFDAWQCRCQKGTFLMLIGRIAEAIPLFEGGLQYFDDHPVDGAETDTATIRTNLALAMLLSGETEKALTDLVHLDQLARSKGYATNEAITAPLLGYAFALTGDRAAAKTTLRRALKVSFRLNDKLALSALGYTGDALFLTGDPTWKDTLADWAAILKATPFPMTVLHSRRLKLLEEAGVEPTQPPRLLLDAVRSAIQRLA